MSDSLAPVKHSDVVWRGLYGVTYLGRDYVIEVDFFDISEKIRLYCEAELVDERTSPASFPLDREASIQAAMSLYGMKRACLVVEGDDPKTLTPLPGTAEARRLSFGKRHPLANKLFAFAAWTVVVVAFITQLPNLVNGFGVALSWLTADALSFSLPTFPLPGWMNGVLAVAGILAGRDRALRMVHNPRLDD